jgi:hypothetical protein
VTGISRTRHYRLFAIFPVLILAFSLTSAGILNANMAISIAAYATKSEGSSGGDSSDGGGGIKGSDSSSGSGGDEGGSRDKSDDNSGGSSDNGSSSDGTSGDNNPTTGEPNPPPPPPIEESPPTVEQPPPPTCEQGSTAPECSGSTESPPPPSSGPPIDCSTSPNDPSCKTPTPPGQVDCSTNPNDPSCGSQQPVDCKTNPDDPSCTTPPPTVDCKANPSDASCITQPVDCTKTPDDPSCKLHPPCDQTIENCPPPSVDCTKNPDDPSCKVDCTTNPSDPSCPATPPCQPAVIGISCPPPSLRCPDGQLLTPDGKCVVDNPVVPAPKCKVDQVLIDGKCVTPPKGQKDCPPNTFFSSETQSCVRDIPVILNCPKGTHQVISVCVPDTPLKCKSNEKLVDSKCVPNPPKCKQDEHLENGKCVKNGPDEECAFNPSLPKCKAPCDENNFCECPKGFSMNEDDNCYPDKPCPNGFERHKDDETGKCFKIICPQGSHLQDRSCVRDITIVKHVTTVETVVKNFVSNNQPSFLLLLDTAQLCQLAGDTQCVAKQNQFDTLNLVTKLDSTGKTWTITDQVENRAVSKIQNNIQVIAYFYDSQGNNVGGPYKGTVNPTVLKSLQLGAFSMKPSTSIMKGTPTFLRLEYQSTATP